MLRHALRLRRGARRSLRIRARPPIPQVELDTTAGKIRIELYPDAAPKTVANFLDYVKAKHYDGTQFHRVIDGFMIQGGGFTPDFKQKPTRPPVVNEAELSSKAGILNTPGTIAMARTSDPNSATVAVLHQRQRQQVPQFPLARSAAASATRRSARSSRAWTSSTRSRRRRRAARPCRPARRSRRPTCPTEAIVINKATVVDARRLRSERSMTKVRLTTTRGPIVLELDEENAPASTSPTSCSTCATATTTTRCSTASSTAS